MALDGVPLQWKHSRGEPEPERWGVGKKSLWEVILHERGEKKLLSRPEGGWAMSLSRGNRKIRRSAVTKAQELEVAMNWGAP